MRPPGKRQTPFRRGFASYKALSIPGRCHTILDTTYPSRAATFILGGWGALLPGTPTCRWVKPLQLLTAAARGQAGANTTWVLWAGVGGRGKKSPHCYLPFLLNLDGPQKVRANTARPKCPMFTRYLRPGPHRPHTSQRKFCTYDTGGRRLAPPATDRILWAQISVLPATDPGGPRSHPFCQLVSPGVSAPREAFYNEFLFWLFIMKFPKHLLSGANEVTGFELPLILGRRFSVRGSSCFTVTHPDTSTLPLPHPRCYRKSKIL